MPFPSMGNSFTCFAPAPVHNTSPSSRKGLIPPWMSPSLSSSRRSKSRRNHHQHHHQSSSTTKTTSSSSSSSSPPPPQQQPVFDDDFIKQQARIASMLYHQHLQNNGGAGRDLLLQMDRSASTRHPKTQQHHRIPNLTKRSRSVSASNTLSNTTLRFVNQDPPVEGTEGKHFVLVHGGGFGAWCWYKIIALLKESNCEVDAIDLTGSGSNFCDINSITTLSQYATPLTQFLENLPANKQVILVGHDLGGTCISYAMEMYPMKVSKAIYVAATMLSDGQSALDIFSQQTCLSELNQKAQKFLYANGKNKPPTAIDFDKPLVEDLMFNKTPSKDIALASVSMRAIPFGPVTQKLALSAANYGSIPRFYIKTDEDYAIPQALQEAMIQSTHPKQVFDLRGSDHSPFFSKPQALHRLLLDISNLPNKP